MKWLVLVLTSLLTSCITTDKYYSALWCQDEIPSNRSCKVDTIFPTINECFEFIALQDLNWPRQGGYWSCSFESDDGQTVYTRIRGKR